MFLKDLKSPTVIESTRILLFQICRWLKSPSTDAKQMVQKTCFQGRPPEPAPRNHDSIRSHSTICIHAFLYNKLHFLEVRHGKGILKQVTYDDFLQNAPPPA